MGLKAKAKSSSERWGMGFLLVFFPEEGAIIDKKANLFSSSSSSSSPSSSSSSPSFSSCFRPVTTVRRSSSSLLFTRAQSTISICALLIFVTLLLFTLSTFEPTATGRFASRRHLSSSNPPLYIAKTSFPRSPSFPLSLFTHNSHFEPKIASPTSSYALQGLGTLYRRGTRAMNDLIVAHVTESDSVHELPLFLRALQRSALLSRSDLVFLFPSRAALSDLDVLIKEENESFLKVICRHQVNRTDIDSEASFDVTQFMKSSKKQAETRETVWGRRIRSNYSEEGQSESTRLSYGSVVAFQADELDPENSLAGFLDHVPMSLRRWACYPMLLGRVRREFKHIMLVEVKETLAHGDPLSRVRNRSLESVHLSTVSESTNATPNKKHGKKNSVKTQSHNHKLVNPATIVGGVRGVRRLSNAMLMEIVRATTQVTQHKRKNSVSESGLLSQLVGNGLILNSVNLITSTESTTDANRSLG